MISTGISSARAILAQELRGGLIHELPRDQRLRYLVENLERKVPKGQPWLRLEKVPGGWRQNPALLRMLRFEDYVRCMTTAGSAAPPHRRNWALIGVGNSIVVFDLALGRELRRLEGHSHQVVAVALSADAARAVSASVEDHTLRVWNTDKAQCLRVLEGHSDRILSVALTADGSRAVSASMDRTIRVWNTDNGDVCASFEWLSVPFLASAISTESESSVRQKINQGLRPWVVFSADGLRALSGSYDKTVRVWNTETGKCIHILDWRSDVHTSTQAADGPKNLAEHIAEYFIKLSGRGALVPLSLNCDGTRALVNARDRAIRFWNTETGQRLCVFEHSARVNAVALSADGTRALSASNYDYTVRVWNTETTECMGALALADCFEDVLLSADGRYILSSSFNRTVKVWKMDVGHHFGISESEGHADRIQATIGLSGDGDRIVTCSTDNTARVWSTVTGECLHILKGHSSWVGRVALSADGRRAFSTSWDKKLRVWNVQTSKCVHTLDRSDYPSAFAVSADGTLALGVASDQTVRVWDCVTGERVHVLEGHSGKINTVALSHDKGRILSGSEDRTVRVWDAETGKCVQILEGHSGDVGSVALNANGTLAVSGSEDRTVRIWDAMTGKSIIVLEGHSASVLAVKLYADDKRALSISKDEGITTVRVWSTENWQCLLVLKGEFSVAALSSDGLRALSGSDDGMVRIWSIRTGECLAAFECPGEVRLVREHPADPSRVIAVCVVCSAGKFRPVSFFFELRGE